MFGRALPQHCQVPFLSTKDPLHELTSKVVLTLKNMMAEKQRCVITLFRSKLSDETIRPGGTASLTSPCHTWILPDNNFQQVPQPRTPTQDQQRVAQSNEQRVGPTPVSQVCVSTNLTTFDNLCRMSDAPPIMNAPNPTTKRALKSTKRVHQRLTCNNVPGTVPHKMPNFNWEN
jgi:hypothetical protein